MTTRKPREERRTEVIEAVLRLAHTLGPDRITAKAIARELGMTQPAIFRHFPRKGDIWQAVIAWLTATLCDLWSQSVAGVLPEERLACLTDAHFRFIAAHPALPLVLLSPELQTRHPFLQGAVIEVMRLFHGELRRAIGDGISAGVLTAGVDVDRAAWMVIALVQGTALRWVASGQVFDIAADGGAIVRLAISGLRTGVRPIDPPPGKSRN